MDRLKTFRECYINNKWIEYTGCSENSEAFLDVKNKKYLGSSEHPQRINGVLQDRRRLNHYWKW